MTRAFGDDQFERELRAILDERAEEVASRARTAAEMTAEISPRLMRHSATHRQAVLVRLAAIVLAMVLVVLGVMVFGARPSRPPVNLFLAVQLPLAGEPAAPPVLAAVQQALADGGDRDGVSLRLPADGVFDDSVDGSANADRAAENIARIAADRRYVAVVGPFHSFVAEATIPIANAAGLLQCSPSNTGPGLTRRPDALSLRPRPDRPSYVRLATTDDTAALAAARLILELLDKGSVFVVTTVEPWAGGRTEVFIDAFGNLGGTVAGRAAIGEEGDTPGVVARQIRASGAAAVFFDGPAVEGARVLAALSGAGTDVPFVGLDIILDGPRSASGSFLAVTGTAADDAYGVFPTGADPVLGSQVAATYEAAYRHPPENYVLAGHACVSIILQAIDRLGAAQLTDRDDWREALRAEVTTPGRRYQTAIGAVTFDANGDAQPQRVSIYRGDANAGDWTFWEMLELGPGG
jgi:branched-chain amino acid transport system substrate-binding protein